MYSGEYKQKGSKFLGYVYPISNKNQVKDIIECLKEEHTGACHFCYAYRLGKSGDEYRINDDGEPSGSAGKPIYGQLLSFNVTNVFAVVVRYYGGTKLGVGGLITAYKSAVQEALLSAEIITEVVREEIKLSFGYELSRKVDHMVKQYDVKVLHKEFGSMVMYQLVVPVSVIEEFKNQLKGFPQIVIK